MLWLKTKVNEWLVYLVLCLLFLVILVYVVNAQTTRNPIIFCYKAICGIDYSIECQIRSDLESVGTILRVMQAQVISAASQKESYCLRHKCWVP